MDVGCYGPFKKMYHDVCYKFTRTTSCTCTVTRNDVCSLVCKVYNRALSAANLYCAFMKTGISPFDRSVISKECAMPADAFIVDENCDKVWEVMPANDNRDEDPNQIMNVKSPSSVFSNKLDSMLSSKREINKAPRKHIGKIVSGQPITEPEIYNKINEHVSIQDNSSKGGKRSASGKCVFNKSADISLEMLGGPKKRKTVKVKKENGKRNEPGPSHINLAYDSTDDESDMESEILDDEKCCVCNKFTPDKVRLSISVIFTKRVKCDNRKCLH